jgi:hypothetical protein
MKNWFDKQSPVIQLALIWILLFIWWIIFSKVFDEFVFGEKKSWNEILLKAFLMGSLFTLLFRWRLVKLVFSKNKAV